MISSTSTTDDDEEEVEASLTTIADAFHAIVQEYEKLGGVVPHMKKMQAANVINAEPKGMTDDGKSLDKAVL